MTIAAFEPRTTLSPADHAQAEAVLDQLQGKARATVLMGPGGQHVVLRDVTAVMAQGRAITVAPHEQVLSGFELTSRFSGRCRRRCRRACHPRGCNELGCR